MQPSKMLLRPTRMLSFASILAGLPLVLAKGPVPKCVTRSAWRSSVACSA
jgi:hypothetical protein